MGLIVGKKMITLAEQVKKTSSRQKLSGTGFSSGFFGNRVYKAGGSEKELCPKRFRPFIFSDNLIYAISCKKEDELDRRELMGCLSAVALTALGYRDVLTDPKSALIRYHQDKGLHFDGYFTRETLENLDMDMLEIEGSLPHPSAADAPIIAKSLAVGKISAYDPPDIGPVNRLWNREFRFISPLLRKAGFWPHNALLDRDQMIAKMVNNARKDAGLPSGGIDSALLMFLLQRTYDKADINEAKLAGLKDHLSRIGSGAKINHFAVISDQEAAVLTRTLTLLPPDHVSNISRINIDVSSGFGSEGTFLNIEQDFDTRRLGASLLHDIAHVVKQLIEHPGSIERSLMNCEASRCHDEFVRAYMRFVANGRAFRLLAYHDEYLASMYSYMRTRVFHGSEYAGDDALMPRGVNAAAFLKIAAMIDGRRAYKTVSDLAGFENRLSGTSGNHKAFQYISSRLGEYGLECRVEDQFYNNVTYRNVVADLPGTQKDIPAVMFMAHLDSMNEERNAGKPAAGADDNASGVAALLELCCVIKRFPLRGPVRLLFTDGEEVGFVGATLHLKSTDLTPDGTAGILDLDMVGQRNEDNSVILQTGKTLAWEMKALLPQLRCLVPGVNMTAEECDLASDGQMFVPFGFPLVSLTDGWGSRPHHHSNDVMKNIDVVQLTRSMRTALGLAALLSGLKGTL